MQPLSDLLDPRAIERLKEWGGPKLARRMVRLFLDTSGERIDQVRSAFRGGSLKEAERGAHSLKSSAANLGATRLQEASASMERLLSQEDLEGARALLDEFTALHEHTHSALAALEGEIV